jgi:hypothetical protein
MLTLGIVRKRSTIAWKGESSVGASCGPRGSCRISSTSACAMKNSGFALSTTSTRTSGSASTSRPNRSNSAISAPSKTLIGGWSMVASATPPSTRTRSAV